MQTGIIHNVESDIRALQQNLKDRYPLGDGFPLFRELLQNADDAGASLVRIAWHDGLRESSHPLLQGPALIVINDGPTSRRDIANIRSLGSNDKGFERGVIGKFGLGLKSAFHLCEAFFYLAFDPESADLDIRSAPQGYLFNPWNGGDGQRFHQEWDCFDPPDVERVCAALAPRLPDGRWFALWVPLRTRAHIGSCAILNEFFGDNSALQTRYVPGDLVMKLARTLPLLSTVKRVEVFRSKMGSAECATLALGSQQRLRDIETVGTRSRDFGGTVEVIEAHRSHALDYFGVERCLQEGTVHDLVSSDAWPTVWGRDGSGSIRVQKAPGDPHCAAVLLHVRDASPQRTRLRLAAYLPVPKPEWELAVADLVLHARFFVDPGRQEVPGILNDIAAQEGLVTEQDIQEKWNRRLLQRGTLGLCLKAVARWAEGKDAELVERLTSALSQAEFLRQHLAGLCEAGSWLCIVEPEEGDKKRHRQLWKLISRRYREVPPIPESLPFFEVFPQLKPPRSFDLTVSGTCRVAKSGPEPWPAAELVRLLSGLQVSIVLVHGEWIAGFLHVSVTTPDQRSALAEQLRQLIQRVLTEVQLSGVREAHGSLRKLVEFTVPEQRIVLPWIKGETHSEQELFTLFARTLPDHLCLPPDLSPEGTPKPLLDTRVVQELTSGLEALLSGGLRVSERLLGEFLQGLFDAANLGRAQVILLTKDAKILPIRSCLTKEQRLVSWQELEVQRGRRLVFVGKPQDCQRLQAVFTGTAEVWELGSEFAKRALGSEHGIPECGPPQWMQAVRANPDYVSPDWTQREALLKEFLSRAGRDWDEPTREGLRILLVGTADSGRLPILLQPQDLSDAEAGLAIRLLAQVAGSSPGWRVLDGKVAEWVRSDLSHAQQTALRIHELTLVAAANILEGLSADALRGIRVNDDDYKVLMRGLSEARWDSLLRRLPIHLSKGVRISIPEGDQDNVYWDGGYPLEGDLAQAVTLLKLHETREISRRQLSLADQLTAAQALDLALSSAAPEVHWKAILKCVQDLDGAFSPELSTRLHSAAWIPTPFGPRTPGALSWLDGFTNPVREHLSSLAAEQHGRTVFAWLLEEPLRKELETLRLKSAGLIPDVTTSLIRLGELLAGEAEHHIGVPFADDQFPNWLQVPWDESLMPAAMVLREIDNRYGTDECLSNVVCSLRKRVTPERLIRILNGLTKLRASGGRYRG